MNCTTSLRERMSEHKRVGEGIFRNVEFRNFCSTPNRSKWCSQGGRAVCDMLQTRKREDMNKDIFPGNLKVRGHFEELTVHWRVITQSTLQ